MKLSKRDFVKGAAAAVAGSSLLSARRALASGSAAAPIAELARRPAVDIVVYNDWFAQARAFAAGFSEQGTRTLSVAGDAGTLWYGTLRGLITNGHRRIAGLTTHTDLLILETLARDQGLRVSQREIAGRLVSWVLI